MGRMENAPGSRALGSVPASVRAAEAGIADLPDRETVVVFDADGNEIARVEGPRMQEGVMVGAAPVGVDVTDLVASGRLRGATFTHNHPPIDGSGGSAYSTFSRGDWIVAVDGQVAEMRAVTPTHAFSIKPGAGGWPRGQANRIVDEIEAATRDRAKNWLRTERAAGRPPTSAQFDVQIAKTLHEATGEVASRYGIAYTRTPRRQ